MTNPFEAITQRLERIENLLLYYKPHFDEFIKQKDFEILSPKDVAKMLGISKGTLANWTKDGKLNAYRIGNRVHYKKPEIEAAMKTLKKYKPLHEN